MDERINIISKYVVVFFQYLVGNNNFVVKFEDRYKINTSAYSLSYVCEK